MLRRLAQPLDVANATRWGGKREKRPADCPEHPGTAINVYRVMECADCETELERSLTGRIAPDLKPQDAVSEETRSTYVGLRVRRQDAVSRSMPIEDQIVAAVMGNPLNVRGIASLLRQHPDEIGMLTDQMIREKRLKRWSDGRITPPDALALAGAD